MASICEQYLKWASDREPFLQDARECAALTLHNLNFDPNTPRRNARKRRTPYQSLGARMVNNLASKLMMAMFPPNIPFFKLQIDDFRLQKLANNPKARGAADAALAKIARAVMVDVETLALRSPIYECLRHLIVAGNALLYVDPKTGRARCISLRNYVCRRDSLGRVLNIITKETIAVVLLPKEVRDLIRADPKLKDEEEVDLYTMVTREETRWLVKQEAGNKPVPGEGHFALDELPWMPLRMVQADGDDYGYSFVGECFGDLNSLEKLRKAIVQFAAAAAKILILVKGNATTKARKLATAESGDILEGDINDIGVLQLEKYADFQVAQKVAEELTQALSFAFMMNTAIQRNGERVTAEEIRVMIAELESTLGGIHSLLSQELQLPLATLLMKRKERKGELPKLPKGAVNPMVVTGVEALGRGNDLQALTTLVQVVQQLSPDLAAQRISAGEFAKRAAAALGVTEDGLIVSDEELQAQTKAANRDQLVRDAAPKVVTEVAKAAMQQGAADGA